MPSKQGRLGVESNGLSIKKNKGLEAEAHKMVQEPLNETLRQRVKNALLNVLDDVSASAAAKASAGRTLLEYFDDREGTAGASGRGAELSLAELDAEIHRLSIK